MVLTSISPNYLHLLQNLALILVSLASLPLSTLILFTSYAVRPLLLLHQNGLSILPTLPTIPTNQPRISTRRYLNGNTAVTASPSTTSFARPFTRRTILVTGVGMTKGLHLARTFHLAGHRVIGADISPYNLIAPCGRFSRSLHKFYTLPTPNEQEGSAKYIHILLQIVHREKVDLWVSCSGVASALDDARAKEVVDRRSDCTSIQFGVSTTQLLNEKDTFVAHAATLGLPVPETHNVTSRDAVHKVLHQSPKTKKRYIMKSIDMDDSARAEIMTVLPRRTLSETYNHLARIPISSAKPWVLQQYVPGKREYCTHALVIHGKVKAFVACPSSELLMHYDALPHPQSALSRAMLRFTEEFASKTPDGEGGMTGHLSFDFLVDERASERGVEGVLQAIECNPRAHSAVVLFAGREKEMAAAYLTALGSGPGKKTVAWANGVDDGEINKIDGHAEKPDYSSEDDIVHPLPTVPHYYWVGHDYVALLLLPLLHLLFLTKPYINLPTYLHNCQIFLDHLLFWHDGTYEIWDPLPAWWLYHVYWPGQFLLSILYGSRWSRINVGSCKMFRC